MSKAKPGQGIKKLDPKNPRHYNDVCIALLARQIEATVVTADATNFQRIQKVVDFSFRKSVNTDMQP